MKTHGLTTGRPRNLQNPAVPGCPSMPSQGAFRDATGCQVVSTSPVWPRLILHPCTVDGSAFVLVNPERGLLHGL
jgi:hypothetical protein